MTELTRIGGSRGEAAQSTDPESSGQVEHLRAFLRWLVPVCLGMAVVEAVVALAFGDPRALATAAGLAGYGAWLVRTLRRLGTAATGPLVHRLAAWMLFIAGGSLFVQPTGGEVISIAALLPVAVALPFLGGRALRRLMILAWLVAILAIVAAEVPADTSGLPAAVTTVIRVGSLGVVAGLLLQLLWQFSTRLKESARQLASIGAMSREIGRTLDPRAVGDLMARHLAAAVGADQCGICYWDRPSGQVVTLGYYPPERQEPVGAAYPIADYPECERALREQVVVTLDRADPGLPANEAEYLQSIGALAIVVVPLVAKGQSIGLVELSSEHATGFEQSSLGLAITMAAEAAITLENARLHEELRHLALHDGLTGLANRTLFIERLERALESPITTPRRGPSAVLFLDLDDFKTVNDRLGHHAGDRLLVAVAERLLAVLRPGDTAARLGGDEFGILLEDVTGEEEAETVAKRLIAEVAAPLEIDGRVLRPGLSVGIATTAPGSSTAQGLLRDADLAMYRAKLRGKRRFERFRPAMRDSGADRVAQGAA